MPKFDNLESWEVVLMVGYQCAVLTVFFFLVSAFLGMAVNGMIISNPHAQEVDVLTVVHDTFNYISTLFMFVSPAIIGLGTLFRPNREVSLLLTEGRLFCHLYIYP